MTGLSPPFGLSVALLILSFSVTSGHSGANQNNKAVDAPGTCSCALPASVPLNGAQQSPTAGVWLSNSTFYASEAPSAAQIASAATATYAAAAAASAIGGGSIAMGATAMSYSSPKAYKTSTGSFCSQLPTAPPNGQCGAGIAICMQGYCCSQSGTCSKTPVACDGTCQCPYSGVGSGCKGAFPLAGPNPLLLPVANPGGVCGAHVGVCPLGQCCSQFGFCVTDSSIYCLKSTCLPTFSPWSMTCLRKSQTVPIKRFDWVVSSRQLAPDGFARPVIVVNGKTLVPIKAVVGDRIVLRVTNLLKEPISLHFHGLIQRETNMFDGVDGTTQRPIMPRETFTYNFLTETSGSYWWHSHHHAQYMDGLCGSLIVTDPTEPAYAFDNVVALSDWYLNTTSVLMEQYLSPASDGDEPIPDDALINFKGQGYLSPSAKQQVASYSLLRAAAVPCTGKLANMARFRFINAGGFAVFNVSVDNHRLILIGEDGVLVEPVEVGSFQINNGQRYDVLLCQRPKPGKAVSTEPVYLRATMINDDFPAPSPHNTSLAIVYFTEEPPKHLPKSTPTFEPPAMTPDASGPGIISPYSQKMLGELQPPPATRQVFFNITFHNQPEDDPTATQYAYVNNISLAMMPESPCLLERYSNNPEGLLPPTQPMSGMGWHIETIAPTNKDGLMTEDVIDLVINNFDSGEHPIHLHGHWFFVMAAGEPGAGVFEPDEVPLVATLARDTVTVNAESYLVLRVVSDNPGLWVMHCHIDWHMAAGLGMILKEGFPEGATPTPP